MLAYQSWCGRSVEWALLTPFPRYDDQLRQTTEDLKKMRVLKIYLMLLEVFIFVMTGSSSESSQLSPDQIVSNYSKACGGEALVEITTELAKGFLVRGTAGKVPLEIVADASGRWRYNQQFAWGDQVSLGYDGKSAFEQDTKAIRGMALRQQLDLRLIADFQIPFELRKLFPEMTFTGSETVEGRELVVVSAQSVDSMTADLAFDKETGLLVRAGTILFQDYREVGSLKRPHKIVLQTTSHEGRFPLVLELTEILHNTAIDDSVFVKPSCPLSVTVPPIHKHHIAVEATVDAIDACVGIYCDNVDTNIVLEFVRQGNHLMFGRYGVGRRYEIKPESDTSYFMEFTGQLFQFSKDKSGRVTTVIYGIDQRRRAERILER